MRYSTTSKERMINMAQYFEKLLNSINQAGYRLPEASVFAALEEFKLQCNQVLAYKHMSLHFRHFTTENNNSKNNDGGYIAIHGLGNVFLANIAYWTYNHPYHTFPIVLHFEQSQFLCQTSDDVEIALNALLDSKIFSHYLALSQ